MTSDNEVWVEMSDMTEILALRARTLRTSNSQESSRPSVEYQA